MGEVSLHRADMLEHANAIACFLATRTTLTASQAYGALMSFINSFEDANKPTLNDGIKWPGRSEE